MLKIHKLNGKILDAWVEKSLGSKILGLGFASNDPETGNPSICRQQESGKYNYLHYFYLSVCSCDLMIENDKEMKIAMAKDGYEYKPDPLIYGHSWHCLNPVPFYSSVYNYGMPLIRDNKISLLYEEQENEENWKACKDKLFATGKTELEAGMRLIVLLKFGENYKKELIYSEK